MTSIFLSHNHADKDFARRLAAELEAQGVRVWIDEAEMNVGESLIGKIENAISNMDYLGVILSPSSVDSAWVEREVKQALTEEIKNRRVKVLPILKEDCEIPGFLKDKLFADFRNTFNMGVKALTRLLVPTSVPEDQSTVAVKCPSVTEKDHTPNSKPHPAILFSMRGTSNRCLVLLYRLEGEDNHGLIYHEDVVHLGDIPVFASSRGRYEKWKKTLPFTRLASVSFGRLHESIPEYVHATICDAKGAKISAYVQTSAEFHCQIEGDVKKVAVWELHKVVFGDDPSLPDRQAPMPPCTEVPCKIALRSGDDIDCSVIGYFGRGESSLYLKYYTQAVKTSIMTALDVARRYERSRRVLHLDEIQSLSVGQGHAPVPAYVEVGIARCDTRAEFGYVRSSDALDCRRTDGTLQRVNIEDIKKVVFR